MKSELPSPLGFWRTVRLLLGATRTRAASRRTRQQELLSQRSGGKASDWGGFGFAVAVLFMAGLNIGAVFVVSLAVDAGELILAERRGKIIVSQGFLDEVRAFEATLITSCATNSNGVWECSETFQGPDPGYSFEARRIVEDYGGTRAAVERKLRDAVRNHRIGDFVTKDQASPGLNAFLKAGPLPAMLGSFVLFWWAAMLVFQGEGLELDLQRRRHPMWEWLFSHPVPPGAIFLAEMISPLAANPIYWGGPLFAGFLYGMAYDPGVGLLATVLIGVPVTIAAACLGKALEIGVILRFPPRSRGAMIGLMGWMGYASMMLFFVGAFFIQKAIHAAAGFLDFFTIVPWPWLRWFLGGRSDGSFSFLLGMLTCWFVAGVTVAGAVWFSVWGAKQGLSGNFAASDSGPSASRKGGAHFGKEPLYRKEFLWFTRDRSAIVQVILIPVTVASVQVFNLRGFLGHAQDEWNYLCGVAILFGTYFLWILGPKSLSSEGTALWIALTWPCGLESLLKAKAWLWSMISSGMVALVLCYAAFLFPTNIWKIALVGTGWFIFGRSMAEKTVTLVSVTSASGEQEKIPWTRRGAAQLGMLTFAIGILTQQWHIAIMGIVYSYLTAAAMWQNFRARLPYLYDPWSETLPPPPTLMHAMISISILVESGAVVTGIILGIAGRENIAIAQAISYGVCAVIVSFGVVSFLGGRGVSLRDVCLWPADPATEQQPQPGWRKLSTWSSESLPQLFLGAAGGVALGLFAHIYMTVLQYLPATAELIRKSQEETAKIPNLKISYAVMAVLFAPFAEEYLFRGLLFRALDREWGGWRAVIGSAAFFAIYHQPLSWLPVGLLGVANALLFKKAGRLAPAVVLHMVYNAVVVLWMP
jgi:membrane protease YdiL (CAAX protease family)